MKGHERIIAIRKRGLMPVLVFVDTNETGVDDENQLAFGDESSTLWIEPGDNISRLDLRCMFGLQASVTGDDPDRVAAVAAALHNAGARRVMAAVMRRISEGRYARFEVQSQTDTDGVFTWPN